MRVFEQSHDPGGRARTKDHNGFLLNLGPHALYRSGAAFHILRELGVEPRGGVPPISGAFAIKDGVKYTFPAGPLSLLTTSLFSLGAKLEAARLLGSISRIDGEAVMGVSISEWVEKHISRVEVRDLMLATFRLATYTNAPDLMSAGAAIEQVKKALIESLSFAFLLALEALTPSQRAVLLLRDVFDYSTREAAEAIGITEASAKMLLHRARNRMRDYDKDRAIPDIGRRKATQQALEKFLGFLAQGDTKGLEMLLTENVVSISDGGGEVAAALHPIRGRDRVMRLVLGLTRKGGDVAQPSFVELNGFPAILVESTAKRTGFASRFTVHVDVDPDGRVRKLNVVVAPSKLTALDSSRGYQPAPLKD